jgi:hypothetical protein
MYNSMAWKMSLLMSCFFFTFQNEAFSQTNPHLNSVLINSCNGSCSEGDNEIIFGTTGDYSVLATPVNIEVTYGSASNPTTTFTDSYINSAAKTATLNTAAGCGSALLIDAANTTIPPNSSFLIVRSTICANALTWSGLCGTGPIYIIYSTDATWNTGGNFVNSTGNTRYFRTRITTTLGVQTTLQYNYTLPPIYTSDGAYATFSSTGGSASVYGDNDCNLDPVLLPSEVHDYSTEVVNKRSVLLSWKTASEKNTNRFEVYHSSDGLNFTLHSTVQAAGNSESTLDYFSEDTQPTAGINYYLLKGIDNDGQEKSHGIQSAFIELSNCYFDPILGEIHFPEEGNYAVYSTDGKLLVQASAVSKLSFDQRGMFLLVNEAKGLVERIVVE